MDAGLTDKPTSDLEPSYGEEVMVMDLLENICSGSTVPEEAEAISRNLLEETKNKEWLMPLALSLWLQEKHQESLEAINLGESSCSDLAEYHVIRGMAARQVEGNIELAKRSYETAIKLDPDRSDTLYNLANLLQEDEPEKAENLYIRSLNINPNSATTWHNFGILLNQENRPEEAKVALRFSLKLDPFVADAWCNLGLSYYALEQFDIAESVLRYTISLDTKHSKSYLNLGNTLISALKAEEAIEFLEKGVKLDPSSNNSLWNLSLAYLLLGRLEEGWRYYESRFNTKDFKKVQIPTSGVQISNWNQLPSANDEALVVWSEQGVGDSIQFFRYLLMLNELGIPFVFLARKNLFTLLTQWTPLKDKIRLMGSTDPSQDRRPNVALMTLPHIFKTRLETIPSVTPYFFAPKNSPEHLQVEIPPGGVSIGLVWASNPDNKAMYKNKSIPLELLMPRFLDLLDLDLIDLHSLQVGDDAAQLDPWRDHERIFDWKDKLEDFSDTANVIKQLDLVISVDTAVAHLSGALNLPTWLLLPVNADFRWFKDRSDSPWYPSMRIFRQLEHGDWGSLVSQIKEALDAMFLLRIDPLSRELLK